MYKAILFDLDGTLTESGPGIMNSVKYALEKFGIRENDFTKLRAFVGPPLIDSFQRFYGLDEGSAKKAVEYYREYFVPKGIFENELYPGVREMLEELKHSGYLLAVASSKPEPYVCRIMDYFEIADFFDVITGSTLDEKRTDKHEVIEETLDRLGMKEMRSQVLMVGDKEHDVFGARTSGLDCIAVLYGYGTREEIEAAAPLKIAETVEELTQFLTVFGD